MNKAILMFVAVMALAGCAKEAVRIDSTNNVNVQVDELFTHNGVTVYRFTDSGRNVYFTSPPVNVQSSHTEYCGKGCLRTVNDQTLAGR